MTKLELKHDLREITDDHLIEDLRRVATAFSDSILRQRAYKEHGNFGVTTVIRRFGSWNSAIRLAGLDVTVERNIDDTELMENLRRVWELMGHQPKYGEMSPPASRYNISTYERRFGSWRKALEQFVQYAEDQSINLVERSATLEQTSTRGSRKVDLAMRFKVLKRDGYRCVVCGASPAISPGVELHVDHIIPYSRGGESSVTNLQTLGSNCNQGKSNRD